MNARTVLALFAAISVSACTTLTTQHQIETDPGEPPVIVTTTLHVPGKGCLYVDSEVAIAETDGLSVNFSSIFKFTAQVVGSVFGSAAVSEDQLESGEGCNGVVDRLYESRSSSDGGTEK